MRELRITSLAACALALMSGAASAATSTANMTISLQVTSGCNVSVTNIAIGAIQATQLATAQTTTATAGGLFTYTCSPGAGAPVLTANQGANYSNGSNQLKGAASGSLLAYKLNLPTLVTATGSAQTAQITATLPALNPLPAIDTYTDTVLLTLTY